MHFEALFSRGVKFKCGGMTEIAAGLGGCFMLKKHYVNILHLTVSVWYFQHLFFVCQNHAVPSKFIYRHNLGVNFRTADFLVASHSSPGRQGVPVEPVTLFVTNYIHANIVSDLSVNYLFVNTARLIADYCYTTKHVEMIASYEIVRWWKIVSYSIIILANLGVLQYPIMRQVILHIRY